MNEQLKQVNKCQLCGEPMPAGEEMFKYHGYSGDCPKPPMPRDDFDVTGQPGPLPETGWDEVPTDALTRALTASQPAAQATPTEQERDDAVRDVVRVADTVEEAARFGVSAGIRLARAAQQATPEPSLFIGACITGGKLHASVMRRESSGIGTVVATTEMDVASLHGAGCMGNMTPATPEPVQPFLVRDVAALIGASVPDVCKALTHLGHGQRSTNMEIKPEEALAVAEHIRAKAATPPQQAAGETAAWRWFNSNGDQVTSWIEFKATQKESVETQVAEAGGRIEYAYTHPAPAVPVTDADALLDFMEAHRVSVTPEYEGPWCAQRYDDEPQFVVEAEGATPRDALRALAASQAKGGEHE